MGKSKEIAELAGHFNVSSTEAVTAADLTVTGDLTVNGTNTTINSATLTVDDKNIVVAQGSADAAAADGAGLTVDGASATLTYASTGDKFVFNKQVDSTVIRATSATGVSLSSTGHGFQVGADNTGNIAMGSNQIQARSNGNTGSLYLNSFGGPVYLGPITGRTILASTGNLTQYGTSTTATTFDPILKLQRSPSDNSVTDGDYLGALTFGGKDSANNTTDYSTWAGRAELTSNGSEEGTIEQYGLKSGTSTHMASFGGNKWQLRSDQTIEWFEHNGTTYDVTLAAATPSIDRTITLPDETGTVVLAETVTNFLSDISVTSGTDAKVTINDNIGEVGAGNIAFQASNSGGSALKPMGFRGEDIRFATGSQERVRINDNGVGIGTDNPGTLLDVRGEVSIAYNASYGLRFYNQGRSNWSSIGNMDTSSGADLTFKSGSGTMVYTNNGNLGIGTGSDPYAILQTEQDVAGEATAIALVNNNVDGSSDAVGISFGLARDNGYLFGYNAIRWIKEQAWTTAPSTVDASLTFSTVENETLGERMRIKSSGNVGIGTNDPGQLLEVNGSGATIRVESTDNNQQGIEFYQTDTKNASIMWGQGNANLEIKNFRNDQQAQNSYANIDFFTGGSNAGSPNYNPNHAMRITDDQNVIVGGGGQTSEKLLVKTGTGGGGLQIAYSDATSPNASGLTLGSIGFQGYSDGNSNASADAKIQAVSDGVHSGSSAPARLEFWVKHPTTGPGSGATRRLQLSSYGEMLLEDDAKGWASFYMNESAGIRYHVKRFYANASVVTSSMLRVKRHYWGTGFYKIWTKQQYYYSTTEAWWNLSGYGRSDGSYNPNYSLNYNNEYGSPGSGLLQLTTPSTSAPGNLAAAYVDVQIVVPAYHHYVIVIEAGGMSGYSQDVNSMSGNDMYALH